MTPKAYLTAMRLDGVRRHLVPGEPTVKIADVANRWGFWHMGQFAADYRRHFGELPSQTLQRRSNG
jgi:AraC family ethanolamine operon transcriptional activator